MMKQLLAGGWIATAVLGLVLQAQEPAPPRSGPPRGGDVADPFSPRPPQDAYVADAPRREYRDGQQPPGRPGREPDPGPRGGALGGRQLNMGLPGGGRELPPGAGGLLDYGGLLGADRGGEHIGGGDQLRPDPVQQQLAEAVRKLQTPDAGEAERQEARKLVSDELRRQFDADLELRRQQLDDLERQIARLREQLQKRTEAKEKLVELRLQLLENESLGLGFPEQWRRLPGAGEPASGAFGGMPGAAGGGMLGGPAAGGGSLMGAPQDPGFHGAGVGVGFGGPDSYMYQPLGPLQPEPFRRGPGPGPQPPESLDRGPRPPQSPQPPRQPAVRAVGPDDVSAPGEKRENAAPSADDAVPE